MRLGTYHEKWVKLGLRLKKRVLTRKGNVDALSEVQRVTILTIS